MAKARICGHRGVASQAPENTLARIHALGREVHAWTVNDAQTLKRMIDLGVDVVISDDPGRMLDLISP